MFFINPDLFIEKQIQQWEDNTLVEALYAVLAKRDDANWGDVYGGITVGF